MAGPSDRHNGKDLRVVSVLLPIPAERPYSYAVPEGMQVAPGDFVQVPLGPRKVAAIVWDETKGSDKAVDPKKLRAIELRFDCPPVDAVMRRFVDWVAHYTLTPPGMVARMVLRVPAALEPEKPLRGLRLTDSEPERLTDARRRVLDCASDGLAWTRSGLANAAGVSLSVVNGLLKQGVFEELYLPPQPVVAAPRADDIGPAFEPDQKEAVENLLTETGTGAFAPILLDGVTGSGKTEVYFEAVAQTLKTGRQVLILLPEIALTAAFLERFEARFGAPPAPWHSGMPPKQRERVWRQVADGTVRVIAGARSALFLPFGDLGLIVVDEEHDSAYKQEDRAYYHARDMAVVRASLGDHGCILASATPSIESLVNAQQGRYAHIVLPRRHGEAQMPDLAMVDMRKHPPGRGDFLSPVLVSAMAQALERGEQSLLFLNRRGYAPLTLCRVCGFRFECNNCSAWLVEHRFRNLLQCHHCGHSEEVPEACPNCGALDHLVACGPGVERLAEEVDRTFPDARIVLLSSDMAGGVTRLQMELEAIAKGEADIVIGTQVVAKGHNFPLLTLVGVVDADLGLSNGDPRAAERTFQLLSQVTGRAGRYGKAARGLLQTYAPENPVLSAIVAGDREAFYQREIALRRSANLPPFSRMAALIISSEDKKAAERHALDVRKALPKDAKPMVLGPAEAPMALVRGRYRYRLLVVAERSFDVQAFLRSWLADAPPERGGLRLHVDIDPQTFL